MKESKFDPRTLLILVLCLSTTVLIVQNVYYLLGIGIISIIIATVFGVDFFRLIKRFKRFIYLLLVISLVQSIFTPDTNVVLSIFNINLITSKGLYLGIRTFVRLLVIFTASSIMTTTNYRETIQGLVQWKVPYVLAFMTSVALRFLPIFTEEAKDAMTALQLRGINVKKIKLDKKIKVYVYMLTPVVMSVLKRAQNLSMAMESRAFAAKPKRVSYNVLRLRAKDYAVQLFAVCASVGYVLLSIYSPIFL